MLWVAVTGLLPAPLLMGLVYLPPPNSGCCPTDLPGRWMRLESDVAAAAATGLIILAGDFIARIGNAPDWPADSEPGRGPRRSSDGAQLNNHGRKLLTNVPPGVHSRRTGPSSEATNFGLLGNGRAVSDYATVSPALLPHVLQLEVLGWHLAPLFTDHATLHLELAIPCEQPSGAQPSSHQPSRSRETYNHH